MADCPISWYITSSISTLWLMFSLLKGPTRSTISSVWQQHMNYGFLLVSWPNINLDNYENISIRITSVWTVFILSITISVIFFQPLPYQIIPHNIQTVNSISLYDTKPLYLSWTHLCCPSFRLYYHVLSVKCVLELCRISLSYSFSSRYQQQNPYTLTLFSDSLNSSAVSIALWVLSTINCFSDNFNPILRLIYLNSHHWDGLILDIIDPLNTTLVLLLADTPGTELLAFLSCLTLVSVLVYSYLWLTH